MRFLFLFALLLTPDAQQVAVQNQSFEQAAPLKPDGCGPWMNGIPGWTSTLLVPGGGVGIFQPTNPNPCEISAPPDGKTVAYLFHAAISQDLGPAQTNGIYVLKFSVANRFYWYSSQYSASLAVGPIQLCSTSGYAAGDFTEITLTCPTQRIYGDLTLTISNNVCSHCYGDFMVLVDNTFLNFTERE